MSKEPPVHSECSSYLATCATQGGLTAVLKVAWYVSVIVTIQDIVVVASGSFLVLGSLGYIHLLLLTSFFLNFSTYPSFLLSLHSVLP